MVLDNLSLGSTFIPPKGVVSMSSTLDTDTSWTCDDAAPMARKCKSSRELEKRMKRGFSP